MKLELISLKNFRQFYGEQTCKFSKDPRKNVTVITGVNGAGKSAILMALTWCLYGREDGNLGELMCKRLIRETKVGQTVDVQVQVRFEHEADRFVATRILRAQRGSGEEWYRDRSSELTLGRIGRDGQYERMNNPTGKIESILPESVSPYFFFDGEKIDQFAKPGHEEQIKSAIRKVLKIEVLERAKNHLKNAARDYQKEFKSRVSGELQLLIERLQQAQEDLDEGKKRAGELRNEKKVVDRQLGDISERLSKIEESRQLEAERKKLVSVLEAKDSEKQRLWGDIREIANKSYVSIVPRSLHAALSMFDEKREKGEIPPGIREQFIEDLLAREVCICGRPITTSGEEHNRLMALLKKAVPSKLENTVIQTAADLRAVLQNSSDHVEQLHAKMKSRADLDVERLALSEKVDELGRKLQGFDHEEVAGLERKRKEWEDKKFSIIEELGRVEERTNIKEAEVQAIEKELDKAKVSEKRAQALQKRLKLATAASEAADKMSDLFAADMRKQIQAEAAKIFKALIWKDTQFQKIDLSEDYSLEVYDRWGMAARGEMSAGERQVLSLAFITGMAKVAGGEAPLVMDTPFARLGRAHRESVTKEVPAITSQLVLLVTDEELREQARKNVESRIGSEYELVFDQGTGTTAIKEVK